MSYKVPKNLLSIGLDAKTVKGEKMGWTTAILYLAPFTMNSKGINLCPHASEGCASACLFTAGRGSFSNVMNSRINKTEYFTHNRQGFLAQLRTEIEKLRKKHGESLAIRLNGTSDIRWEKFKIDGLSLMETFPDVQFYDYTKNPKRFNNLPENYSLTFSRSESNEESALSLVSQGIANSAIVFDRIPETYKDLPVYNGDDTDLRFLDPKGVIVGLKAKGKARKDLSGFVVNA